MLSLDLKKLLFYSKKSREKQPQKLILLGDSPLLDVISMLVKEKNNYKTEYIKLTGSDKISFKKIYIPETMLGKLKLTGTVSPLKFTFINKNFKFPVINNFEYFCDCYKTFFGNGKDIENFKIFFDKRFITNSSIKKYFAKNFSENFYKIICSVLYFYGYNEFSNVKILHLKEILKNYFSNNATLQEIPVNKEYDSVKIKKLDSALIINGTPHTFDLLITDTKEFLSNKYELVEKFVEFKIKKYYTNEFFPENIIYNTEENYINLQLIREDDDYKYFKIEGSDKTDIIFPLFKEFFPLLNSEDLTIVNKGIKKYLNFKFKGEKFPFNFYEKLLFINKEVL